MSEGDAPRGREHFEWLLGWRQAEDATWTATAARTEARAAAAAARAASRAAASARTASAISQRETGEWDAFGETDLSFDATQETATAVIEHATRSTGDLGYPVVPDSDVDPVPDAPHGREYFAWVLGWREPDQDAPVAAPPEPHEDPGTDWLVELEAEPTAAAAPVDEAPFAFTDWMERPPAPPAPEPESDWLAETLPPEPALAPPVDDQTEDRDNADTRPTGEVELPVGYATERDEAVTGEFSAVGAPATDEETEVESPHRERSFVLKKFHSFYHEIIRFRNQKSVLAGGFATAIADGAHDATQDKSNPETAAAEMSTKWRDLLQLYAAEAKWLGGDASGRYPDAQFAMVAFGDEVLATSDWAGRAAAGNHRLEEKFYGTDTAATMLFRDFDHLLRDQRTPANRDLAVIYLQILAAGFEGMHRESGDPATLTEYRRRFYEFAHGRNAELWLAGDRPLLAQTARHTILGRALPRISMAQRWSLVVVGLVIAYLAIANVVWNRTVADLTDVIGRIPQLR